SAQIVAIHRPTGSALSPCYFPDVWGFRIFGERLRKRWRRFVGPAGAPVQDRRLFLKSDQQQGPKSPEQLGALAPHTARVDDVAELVGDGDDDAGTVDGGRGS